MMVLYILGIIIPILILTLIRQRIIDGNPQSDNFFCRWGLHELEDEVCKICKHVAVQNFFYFLQEEDYTEDDPDIIRY